ncbi:MAG: Catalase KatE, partial [uncultured Solirubrobacterales bacterium]
PAQGAGGHQPARRSDGLRSRRPGGEPARQLRALDHRRAQGVTGRARRRARAEHRGPPDPRAPSARQRLQAGRRALPALGGLGARRPRVQSRRRAFAVRPPDPGADGLAPVHGRGRARPAGRRGPRDLGRRRARPRAAARSEPQRRGARAARQPRVERTARCERARDDPLRAERARRAGGGPGGRGERL